MFEKKNRPFLRATRLAFLACFVLSGVALADPETTYKLKLHLVPGQKWSFDGTSVMKQKGQVTANGKPAQAIEQAFEQRRKGTIEVLSTEGGLATSIRITFDPASANTGASNGVEAPAFALAGKTVVVKKENGAVTTDMDQAPDPQTLSELSAMLQPDTSVYPKEPVAVGQEWKADVAAMAKAFSLGADDKVDVKCKLTGVSEVNGRQVADVAVDGTVLKHEQQFVEIRTTISGVNHIDLQTGQSLAGELTGKIVSKGSNRVAQADGTQVLVAVEANGEIAMKQSVKLLADPSAGGNPPVADNPLARPAPPAMASFAGSYKGDKVALELAESPDGFTGALTVGDKKFPVLAKAEAGKLSGTFESDGSKFNLSATLEGNTLTLSSDGNTFTLKKAATNPLSAPKPRNPLAQ